MNICLHLGAHRTGTTSLQRYLNLNRKSLSDNGVAFWGPGRTRSGLMNGLIKDPHLLTSEDHKLARRSVGRLQVEQKRLRNKGFSTVVLSEENLMGTMNLNLSSGRLYPQAEARLKRIAPAFFGKKLRIGLSIRSYDAHWASQIAFRVKVGAQLPMDDALDRLATQPRRWKHVVQDVARAFPDAQLLVWPFEGWIGQPEQMLSALLGWPVPVDLVRFNERCNASPDAQTLRKLLLEVGDTEAAARLAGQFGHFQPFPQAHKNKLQDDYRDDIDWLQAGADGLAAYLDPTRGTSGGLDMTRGSETDDIEERILAGTG